MIDFTIFRELVETKLKAEFTSAAIKFENVKLNRGDHTNWISCFDTPVFAESTGMGESTYHSGGMFLIQIFTPLDTGTQVSRTIASELSNIFESQDIEGFYFDVPQLHPAPHNERWYQVNLHIPYTTVMGQVYSQC